MVLLLRLIICQCIKQMVGRSYVQITRIKLKKKNYIQLDFGFVKNDKVCEKFVPVSGNVYFKRLPEISKSLSA